MDIKHEQLEKELSLYENMVNAAHDSITLIDRNYVYKVVNDAYIKGRKKKRKDILNHTVAKVWGEKVFDEFIKDKLDICFKGETLSHQSTYEFNPGELNYIETTYYPCFNSKNEVTHAVVISHNITELKQREEKIKLLAYYDSLTKLPNRLLFMAHLSHEIEVSKRNNTSMAVFFLDLDQFKKINDTLGHAAGDELLIGVAERLQKYLRKSDTVSRFGEVISYARQLSPENFARLGGDEFTLIIPDLSDKKFSNVVAEKVIKLFKNPFMVSGKEMFVSTSIGIAVYPDNGNDVETLLKNADTAMYKAKSLGRNTFQYYSPEMNAEAMQRINLESKMRHALRNDEFLLYFQPQYDVQKENLVGAEALIRWQNPELGLVSPADFIPLAEETGLIIPIGEWVMRSACRQAKIWHDQGFDDLQIAVNLSPKQFHDASMVEKIKSIIESEKINPGLVELEITEGAMMQDTDKALHFMNQLKQLGLKISLDDFGTGYSSLTYLKKFPIDVLKIDQAFVRNADLEKEDGAIISAIVAMCIQLGIKVVAEGVETEGSLHFLKKQQCHYAQGYFFSRPLPASEFEKLLHKTREN